MTEKLPPVVYVRWKDSWSSPSTYTESEIAKEPNFVLESAGFLIRNDKRGVTIASQYERKQDRYRHVLHVPKSCILKIKKL